MEKQAIQQESKPPIKAANAALAGGLAMKKIVESQPAPLHWPPENGDYFNQHEIPFGD